MNKELYANLDEKEYNVEDYYHETGVIQAIARSDAFNQVTLSVIAVNAVWIGIDSDHNNAQPPELHFQVGDQFFCIFFTTELMVRFLAFKHKQDCLRDMWFKFDSVLVS